MRALMVELSERIRYTRRRRFQGAHAVCQPSPRRGNHFINSLQGGMEKVDTFMQRPLQVFSLKTSDYRLLFKTHGLLLLTQKECSAFCDRNFTNFAEYLRISADRTFNLSVHLPGQRHFAGAAVEYDHTEARSNTEPTEQVQ